VLPLADGESAQVSEGRSDIASRSRSASERMTLTVSEHKLVSRRFVGSALTSSEKYSGYFTKLTNEVIAHLAAVPGVKLPLNLSIDAVRSEGFATHWVRAIRENAATLKFTTNEFESDGDPFAEHNQTASDE
jgi:hypothetical protein